MAYDDSITVQRYNEVFFRIDCNYEQAVGLKNALSCYAPNYIHSPKYKAKMWDGKISFFDMRTALLPIGLIDELKTFAFKNDYELKYGFEKSEMVDRIKEEEMDAFYARIFGNTRFYPRDYQHDAIYAALKRRRGVIEACTGAGKSLVIYTIIRRALEVTDGNILLVVPNIALVNQMFSDFKEYGWEGCDENTCILYGKTRDLYDSTKRILISTWQSIYKKEGDFFEQFETIVVDEVHGVNQQSNALRTILSNCVNARYRIGLTGTLPDFPADLKNIVGYIGPRISQVGTQELIERGVLSKILIRNVLIRYSDEEIKKRRKMNYAEEIKFIIEHEKRNKVLGFILKNINRDENSIILCERVSHLKSMHAYLSAKFPDRKVVMIHGNVDANEREYIRKGIDNKLIDLTFGHKKITLFCDERVMLSSGLYKKAKDITYDDDVSDDWIKNA